MKACEDSLIWLCAADTTKACLSLFSEWKSLGTMLGSEDQVLLEELLFIKLSKSIKVTLNPQKFFSLVSSHWTNAVDLITAHYYDIT